MPISLDADTPETTLNQGRRRLLLILSWSGLGLLIATFGAAVSRFFWPRVSVRPDRSVRVGFPEEYRADQVVYYPGPKLFVARDEKGFFSLSARCTHLGCMAVWNRDHRVFLCPCHGGKYDAQGRTVEGPPPRPLNVLAIELDDNGFLVVDPDRIIRREKGSVPQFRPDTPA